jgi:hypothetical protein
LYGRQHRFAQRSACAAARLDPLRCVALRCVASRCIAMLCVALRCIASHWAHFPPGLTRRTHAMARVQCRIRAVRCVAVTAGAPFLRRNGGCMRPVVSWGRVGAALGPRWGRVRLRAAAARPGRALRGSTSGTARGKQTVPNGY